MKKILIAFAAAAALLCACDDDNTSDEKVSSATITISTETLTAAPEGAQQSVTVTSSGDWRLAGVCDWAHPSATSGKSGETVTFTIDPNTTEAVRTATFKFFTGPAVAPLTINSEIGYRLELLSSEEMYTESPAEEISIQLNTNIPELTCEVPEWVTYSNRTDAFGKTILSFAVSENATYINRSGNIVISSDKAEEPITVALTQEQTNTIIIDDVMFDLDMTAQDVTVVVKSNVDYDVNKEVDWISEGTLVNSNKQEDGLTADTYTFTLTEATGPRGSQVTFYWEDLFTQVTMVQKDPDTEVVNIPDGVFRANLVSRNWVLDLGGGACIVLEDGLNATSFSSEGSWYDSFESVEGIESFPNLESITINYHNIRSFDISKLKKVTSVTLGYCIYLNNINLGDNAVKTLNPFSYWGYNYYSYATSFAVAGTKLESLDCGCDSYFGNYDTIESIDVSGCPALTTLNAVRGSRLKTLYLKEGQVIPNLTKEDYTEIKYK